MSVALSDHLPLLASAPDGIQKLRGLILELAVRGKLVPQDPADEPASELLKRIGKERARLEVEGTCRKAKPTPLVSNDEQPFALPEGWAWIRLGQIGDWGAGATPLRSNPRYYGGSIPWFKSGELTADFISDAEEHVTELALKECSLRQNRTGDVLIAMYGATIGKTAILAKPATTNQAVCACTPNTGIFNRYLLTLLKALKPNFIGQGAGGAQPNISREKIVATVAALPPEAEQHRIVAKVDELMALCDQMEAEQADAASAHARLVETLLGTLNQSIDAADLAANWQRLAEYFDTLFTTEASIDALKQTVLQLAVMGKLVPQDPSDEPASKIFAPDKRLESLLPHEIPRGWTLTGLSNLAEINGGFAFKSTDYTDNGMRVVRISDFDELGFKNHKVVRHPFSQELSRFSLAEDNILMAMTGGTVGKSYLVKVLPEPMIVNQRVATIKVLEGACPTYVDIVIRAEGVQAAIRKAKNSTNDNISMSDIKGFAIPLPPIAEQRRIVAKVDELMALCDNLKADIVTACQHQTTLTDTLIKSALEEV